MILLVADARAQWTELDRRIAAFDAEFIRWAKENEDARRLTTIPGFGGSPPLRLPLRSGERRALIELVIFRRGWASSLSSSRPAANRSCSASASAATHISASSRSMERARRCPMWLSATRRWAGGRKRCLNAPIAMSRSSPSPTSWPGSPGRWCGAENGLPSRDRSWRRSEVAIG